jgi:trimeric autotransporter adhesin
MHQEIRMSRQPLVLTAILAIAAGMPTGLCAQSPCTPEFSDRFASGDMSGAITSMIPFGQNLYAAGAFLTAGNTTANRVARWTGQQWEPLGSGLGGTANALVIFDDGGGPALYATGSFTTAGGNAINRIAKWNGTDWSALGSGLSNIGLALAVFDEDGPGPLPPHLFAGGQFTEAGGATAPYIARWNGATWSALETGCDSPVQVLAVEDLGTGPSLYLGGFFLNAGGTSANRIARWDGSTFHALGQGAGSNVEAIGSFDPDGPGPLPRELIAGGGFTTIGGVSANRIARWNGSTWADMGAGVGSTVTRVRQYDDGSGPALYVGGYFTTAGGSSANRVARWNGSTWATLGTGTSGTVFDIVRFDDGRGERLFVGGGFTSAGGAIAGRIAAWNGQHWSGLGRGVDAAVEAITSHDFGAGTSIYIGGSFIRADGIEANRIARFDGTSFYPLGTGMPSGTVNAITGFAGSIYAAGTFTQAGGMTANRIARWDGAAWHPLIVGTANGVPSTVNAMTVWNDGTGATLYITGSFTSTGGVSGTSRIARWNGANWSQLAGGINNVGNALAVFNDGTGEALYVGGTFTAAGGSPASRIARWNGSAWADVGGGLNNTVNTLAVYNDGTPRLYAGGTFTVAGATSVNRIARWDGTSWADVATGVNGAVSSMGVYSQQTPSAGAPALFVSGAFTIAGGSPISRLARWDGSAWSAVGPAGNDGLDASASAMLAIPSGPLAGLHIGGSFSRAGNQSSASFATWRCSAVPPPACYANCDQSATTPILNVEDFTCFVNAFALAQSLPPAQQVEHYANCDQSSIDPVLNVEDFTCFINQYAQGCP